MIGGAYFPFDISGFAAARATLSSLIALIKLYVGKIIC